MKSVLSKKSSSAKDGAVAVSVMGTNPNLGLKTKFLNIPLYLYFVLIFVIIGILYIVISHASPVYSTISADSSGQCLTVQNNSNKNGKDIVQEPCSSTAHDNLWQLVSSSKSGYYEIAADSSGQCLNVNGNSTKEGAAIIQWPCSSTATNNLWKLVPTSTSGYYEIASDSSGQCLNVYQNSSSEGANIIQWPCSSSAENELWSGTVLSSTVPTPAPSVTLSANPTSVSSGQASTITWSSLNASSCTASGGWTGSQTTSGSVATAALTTTTTYDISCTAANQTPATASATVTVTPPPTTTGGGGTADPSGVPIPTGNLPSWNMVYSDDFTSSTDSCWGKYSANPIPSSPTAVWEPSHVTFTGGEAVLSTSYDSSLGLWASGGMGNCNSQTYGKYEVRFKMDQAQGVKYAILLWPKSGNWPCDGEIDFGEDGGGDRATTTLTNHYCNSAGANEIDPQINVSADFSQWQTIGIEWTAGKIVWTLNGQDVGTITANVPADPMWMAIQSESNTNCSINYYTCINSTTPSTVNLDVDWVVEYAPST